MFRDCFCVCVFFMVFTHVVYYCANNYLFENLLWISSFEIQQLQKSLVTTSDNGVSAVSENTYFALLMQAEGTIPKHSTGSGRHHWGFIQECRARHPLPSPIQEWEQEWFSLLGHCKAWPHVVLWAQVPPGLHKHQELWMENLSPCNVKWQVLTWGPDRGAGHFASPSVFPCLSCRLSCGLEGWELLLAAVAVVCEGFPRWSVKELANTAVKLSAAAS